MRAIVLTIIAIILSSNLMAEGLELKEVWEDMEQYKNPTRCDKEYSVELCSFAVALISQAVLLTSIIEKEGKLNDTDYIKVVTKIVCPYYRKLSGGDRALLFIITINGERIFDKDNYKEICY